jgi:hypothetical protein
MTVEPSADAGTWDRTAAAADPGDLVVRGHRGDGARPCRSGRAAPGRLREDLEADHWAELRSELRRHGVVVDAQDLKRLAHDVVLGEGLLTRIGRAKEAR